MVFTDPPYNVRIDGHVSGLGRVQHREFAMASGEMTEDEFTQFLKATLGAAVNASRDGALHYVCMDWRHLFETLSAGRAALRLTSEHLRLEQGQWRHGIVLPVKT